MLLEPVVFRHDALELSRKPWSMRLRRVPSGSAAAALDRPAAEGGSVVVVADAALRPVQALLRWDPAWHAARELADGTPLGVLPATRIVALTGTPSALGALLPVRSARLTPLPLDAVPGPVVTHRFGGGRRLSAPPRSARRGGRSREAGSATRPSCPRTADSARPTPPSARRTRAAAGPTSPSGRPGPADTQRTNSVAAPRARRIR